MRWLRWLSCTISAAALTAPVACMDLNAPGGCAPNGCEETGSDAQIDSTSSETMEAADTSADSFETAVADSGIEAEPDAAACGDSPQCTPGDVRLGGVCPVDEIGTEKCSTSCVWVTTCAPKTGWRAIAYPPGPFVARYGATAVWTGSDMVIAGGEASGVYVNTAAAYNYASDTWKLLANFTVSARSDHTAVWTGSRMIIWGGYGGLGPVADGASYDPSTDAWAAIAGATIAKRRRHGAVWATTTGEMIVWGGTGGCGSGVACDDGAAYNPSTNTWSTLPAAPIVGRVRPHMYWTGTEVIIWGGTDAGADVIYYDGARYNPSTKAWVKLPAAPTILDNRNLAASAWSAELFLWGGETLSTPYFDSGASYSLTGGWKTLPTPASSVISARSFAQSWAGAGKFFVWSGLGVEGTGGSAVAGGAAYDPITATWAPMLKASEPPPRISALVVWTGKSAIVWGGKVGLAGTLVADGAAYRP